MAIVNMEVEVQIDRAPVSPTGQDAGYQVSVQPWILLPSNSSDTLGSITRNFEALSNLLLGDITINFKSKPHFVPLTTVNSDFVVRDTTPQAAIKTIVRNLDPTFSFMRRDYNYVIEFSLVDQGAGETFEVELDPGYRVKP